MPEPFEKSLLPVFAAMTALDEAISTHNHLNERLAGAMEEGARLDEQLRRIDPADHEKLESAAQALAFAVALVQSIARREERARVARSRAQAALAEIRIAQSKQRLEELRIELEIDAASIWDMLGRFEAEVRERLEDHAKLAAEMHFVASVAGEQESAAPAAAILTPALGTSGPDLWSALAGGVRQLYDRHGAPIIGRIATRPTAKEARFDFARPALLAEKVVPSAPPVAPAVVAPPEVPAPMEPRFDFARRTVVAEKIVPVPAAGASKVEPVAPTAPRKVASVQSPAAKKDTPVQSPVRDKAGPVQSRVPDKAAPVQSPAPDKAAPIKSPAPDKAAPALAPAAKKVDKTRAPITDPAPPPFELPKSAGKRAPEPPPPVEPQRERGRLDQMLRNLVGIVGSKPASRR